MAQKAEEDYEATRMEEVAIPSVADWELFAGEGDADAARDEGKTEEVRYEFKTKK